MYHASKSELADLATARGLDASGTVEDLRRRLRDYLERHPEEDTDLEPTAAAGPSTETFTDARDALRTPITLTLPVPSFGPAPGPPTDDAKVISQIRKWGCHFDGKDPISFLERLAELRDAYGPSDQQLLKGLPELLRGDPLLWLRNNRDQWRTWTDFERDFRTQFLPRRYQAALRREITDRRQRSGEAFNKYATEMLTLMRRAGGFNREEQVDRLYENMSPDYKMYVRYDDATSISELQARAADFEHIEKQRRDHLKATQKTDDKPAVAAAYNKEECYSGSEVSFINDQTAERAQQLGYQRCDYEGQIQLANGATAEIPGTVRLPVQIGSRTFTHEFSVLPTLESDVLIGVDLWARTEIILPPPPPPTNLDTAPTCGKLGGLTPTSADERQRLEAFLATELEKFKAIRGLTDKASHQIRLKHATPIKQRYRPRNPAMQAIIDREVAEMEAAGVIEPSRSAWSSPVVIVKKKDGKQRFCIDFRKVNDVTERDAYPLPQITATLDKLRGARYLTTLDLKNGYWQVPLTPESRPITAFTIPGRGLYQFTVMRFGLHSAPATFQRLLDNVLGPEMEPNVFVYLDDIIVISATFDQHLRLLAEVFHRLRDARLRLNPDKCRFCVDQLKYLGHVIDCEGIRTDPEKTDASTSGLGAVLTQNFEEGERVIAYASRTLNGAERNYSATELECLAVVWGIRRMKGYLEGYPFTVITDHQSLRWLQRLEAPTGRLARWLFELQQYDVEVTYRRGVLNRVADALSRQPTSCAATPLRCKWYQRLLEEVNRDPARRPDYRVTDGRLLRHLLHSLDFKEHLTERQWKECVPQEQRTAIIHRYHDAPTAGHLGIAKTIARIAERFYWPGMFREIAGYVRASQNCQAHKADQVAPAGAQHATNIQRPWEHVTVDLVGPLPRSRKGHTWLFVLQDRFTKWVELVPLRQATAGNTTKAITERVCSATGARTSSSQTTAPNLPPPHLRTGSPSSVYNIEPRPYTRLTAIR
ncbi:reverse ribonuclease integrase [Lasius niger]|uniref:RNA-directed DNA polymerase n=1 Tax=Lasius niger TaxID=67767 RepID=A0A0J7N2E1_LASNI|nr:reverse ribonuclease integrase [Lasius niger]